MGNIKGITMKEVKAYLDILIKANDTQLDYLLYEMLQEKEKRRKEE